ncbi:hypothetical protein GW17_00047720 [Ensete ventricosum]|nr:hypothetical protein GW17_00047720 [Ensete ventricosum]
MCDRHTPGLSTLHPSVPASLGEARERARLGFLGVARMEGGGRGNPLDPAAAEFYPVAGQFALGHPQIYYSCPPPPPLAVALPVFHHQQPQQVEMATAAGTRAVALSMVPRHVGEAEVRAGMEAFGGVRAVELGLLAADGVVTVHFYDLRSAEAAVAEVREQHARRHARIEYGGAPGNWVPPWLYRSPELGGGSGQGTIAGYAVWAQFAASSLEEPNQGSIVVLNSDPRVSFATLRDIFEPFGIYSSLLHSSFS